MQEIKITLRYTLPKRVCKRLKVIIGIHYPRGHEKLNSH